MTRSEELEKMAIIVDDIYDDLEPMLEEARMEPTGGEASPAEDYAVVMVLAHNLAEQLHGMANREIEKEEYGEADPV